MKRNLTIPEKHRIHLQREERARKTLAWIHGGKAASNTETFNAPAPVTIQSRKEQIGQSFAGRNTNGVSGVARIDKAIKQYNRDNLRKLIAAVRKA
mgnify:CR=1 FL=1